MRNTRNPAHKKKVCGNSKKKKYSKNIIVIFFFQFFVLITILNNFVLYQGNVMYTFVYSRMETKHDFNMPLCIIRTNCNK